MKVDNDILIPEIAKMLASGKEVRFTPSGDSMRPFIEGDRDSVVLAKLDREPQIGDIVLASALPSYTDDDENIYVLHRIVEEDWDEDEGVPYVVYDLEGDGNLSGREFCGPEEIYGTVIRIESPRGFRKLLTRGKLWLRLKPHRPFLLKIYRHTILKWFYK